MGGAAPFCLEVKGRMDPAGPAGGFLCPDSFQEFPEKTEQKQVGLYFLPPLAIPSGGPLSLRGGLRPGQEFLAPGKEGSH